MRLLLCVIGLFLGFAAATPGAAENHVVTGTASYRERIALPPGAVFEAVLEDVTIANAPAHVLGRTTIADPGNPPFEFEVDFDTADIDEDRTYAVRAQVAVGRKLIFVSDTMNPVLTNGATNDVHIWMIKVGDTSDEARAAPPAVGAHGLRLPASFNGVAALRRLPGGAVSAEPLARPGVPPAAHLGRKGHAPRFDRAVVGRPGRARAVAARRGGGAEVRDPRTRPAPAPAARRRRRSTPPRTSR